MARGKLIIIESGADGSGKATQTERMYDRLRRDGQRVKKVSFPNYDSDSSALVKMYLNGEFGENAEDVDAYVASTFFAVDRYASYKTDWKEFYESGGVVISDRYTTSNMIHQGAKMETRKEIDDYLDWLYDLEYKVYKIPKPDYVIYLDVHPDISEKLMAGRSNKIDGSMEKDIHERDKEHLLKSYQNSKYIAEKYGWEKIECTSDKEMRSIEDISEEIYEKILLEIKG